MSDLTLLVMAAGKGSRFGGLKQVEPLGPSGEAILDYTIYDAKRAGFQKVVFAIRRDIESSFRESLGGRIEKQIAVEYVFQDEPTGNAAPLSRREKPWGTAHAILVAAGAIESPFAVVNADDYYGAESIRLLGDHFRGNDTSAALVGFDLRRTLSEFGTVNRGLCQASPDGRLESVTELEQIQSDGTGVKSAAADGTPRHLTGDEIVSMNLWGFLPTIFDGLSQEWSEFLRDNGQSVSAEFYITAAITNLIGLGKLDCRILRTSSDWFGITYQKDRDIVAARLRELVDRRVYPESLWP